MSTVSNGIVFLPIEVKARGLEPRAYLGLVFATHGYRVLIGRKSTLSSLVKYQKAPVIWIDKGMDSRGNPLYREIKSKEGFILQLHEEGAVMQKGFEEHMVSFETGAYGEDAMKLADLHLMWGQNTFNRVAAKWPQYKHKLRVVGHPKFDLYRKMQKTERGAGYLLVSTSFVIGNPKNGEAAFLQRLRRTCGDAFDLFDWGEKARHSKNIRIELTKLVQELAAAFPQLKIVVRPHPAENKDYYYSKLSDLDSVSISAGGSKSFREDLKGALAVLHHDCSTGIEATIAGYPVISYSPFDDTEHSQQLAVDASKQASTQDEVKRLIANLIDSDAATLDEFDQQRNSAISVVEHHIALADHDCSSAIVDLVQQLSPTTDAIPSKFSLVGRLKRTIIQKLFNNKNQDQKFASLDFSEINKIASEFAFKDLKCSQFERDTCLIERTGFAN